MRTEELTAKILRENPKLDNYQLSIAVSKRSDELLNGGVSKLNVDPKSIKAADLALMEIAEGLLDIKGFVNTRR